MTLRQLRRWDRWDLGQALLVRLASFLRGQLQKLAHWERLASFLLDRLDQALAHWERPQLPERKGLTGCRATREHCQAMQRRLQIRSARLALTIQSHQRASALLLRVSLAS